MNLYEPIGYLASLLVLATFCMRSMVALRAVAIVSNVAFIAYGWLVGIDPVLVLHVVLLPTNVWRLVQAINARRPRAGSCRRPPSLGASVRRHAARARDFGRGRR